MTATKRLLHLVSVDRRRRYEKIAEDRLRLFQTGETREPPEISPETIAVLQQALAAQQGQPIAVPEDQPAEVPPPEPQASEVPY